MRWFFSRKKRQAARVERHPGRKPPRSKKADHRHQPAPLTWNDPERDFITRYGDPFD